MWKNLKEFACLMLTAVIVGLVSIGVLFGTLWICGVRDF